MTLCIAAICEDKQNGTPKIVLCTDMERETEGVGSSETEDKVGFVRPGWPALEAGVISKANELVNEYAGYLSKNFKDIDEFNLIGHMRKVAHVQKAKLVDHYLQQSFSINRAYFYGDGKAKLPEEFMLRQQDAIARVKLEASLIIAGFIEESDFVAGTKEPRPFLCVVDDSRSPHGIEEVGLEYEYDAVGSGAQTALSMLYRREQDSGDSLAKTIYNVYEANCMSDKVPGVGRKYISIDVLYADGHLESVSDAGYKYLGEKFSIHGPKPVKKGDLKIEDGFLEPFDQEKKKPTPAQQV